MRQRYPESNRRRRTPSPAFIIALFNFLKWSAHGYLTPSLSLRRSIIPPDKPSYNYQSIYNFRRRRTRHIALNDDGEKCREKNHWNMTHSESPNLWTRRRALQIAALGGLALFPSTSAQAAIAEYDQSTGALYTPKADMLRGGSTAARGIKKKKSGQPLKPGQKLQNVYDTRFIAYLSRFLLSSDPSARAWWFKGIGTDVEETRFAQFAESVEIGLADYFSGPYGSYSSVQAAKAGINAAVQAKSARADTIQTGVLDVLKETIRGDKEKERRTRDSIKIGKNGVLNLFTLLKVRYASLEEKKQLTILFTFFAQSELQPTTEIRSLLGEIDDASIEKVEVIRLISASESTSRTSSRRGGGYTLTDPPNVSVEEPPALGNSYVVAKMRPIMEPTSRVLRIRLLDGGAEYTRAPTVTVIGNCERPCSACAILDRDGHVESILVLDPGYGYGKKAPRVEISKPRNWSPGTDKVKAARAVADMEYQVTELDIVEPGNGYVATEPPKITIDPPKEDPDWFFETLELTRFGNFRAVITKMKNTKNEVPYGAKNWNPRVTLDRVRASPLELLPSTVRPELNSYGVYIIPKVAAVRTYDTSPNIRFRAMDPLFGSIGKVPVTKNAAELKSDEYGRLSLSGAVCTVLVRTVLNPLELIKTKLQLQNDKELFQFAEESLTNEDAPVPSTHKQSTAMKETEETEIGTVDLIKSVIGLRGAAALFQSADITFLASVMFGSFGFGATELFRRSFTMTFFTDGGDFNSEFILLLAATAATIVTSAAAAPFELLRVRSMGLVESKSWIEVLKEFLQEKGINASREESVDDPQSFWSDVKAKDLLPLFAGFPPTASRELAFAIPKFLAFDVISKSISEFVNSNAGPGSLPVQVGVGTEGLVISAFAGALAGIAGAIVSHPADFILTKTSASEKKTDEDGTVDSGPDWREVVKDLLQMEGGIANLFVGLQPRLIFFFLVIGLQFFLYDYVKILLQVGSDDLSLVLDVFYAVRQGL